MNIFQEIILIDLSLKRFLEIAEAIAEAFLSSTVSVWLQPSVLTG